MEENQSPISSSPHREQNEVSLLDMLVTVAENAKLLIIGPLIVGLVALGVGYTLPKRFESVAVIQSDQAAASGMQATAKLATSAAVLDPVVVKLGLAKDVPIETARSELRQSVKATYGRSDKLLTLIVSGPTPQQAQDRAYALLDQIYIQSGPKGAVRDRLEAQLAEVQMRFTNAENVANILLKRLDAPFSSATAGNELSRGYAELLTVASEAQTQITLLQAQLEVLSEAQLVQKPTLAQTPSQPKKALLAIGAAVAMGVLLLLFVFIRQALRNTAANAEAAVKLTSIRRALGLKSQGI